MPKYKVVGPRAVRGVKPGGTVDIPEGSGVNVEALIASGHVQAVKAKPASEANAEAAAAPSVSKGGEA